MYIKPLPIKKAQFDALETAPLSSAESRIIQNWDQFTPPNDIPAIDVWALRRVHDGKPGGAAILVGECPICGGTHVFGLGSLPLRALHGGTVALRFNAGPVPEHLRFAIANEPEDLIFLANRLTTRPVSHAARVLPLANTRASWRGVRRLPVAKMREAFQALVGSGIFLERMAIITEDGREDEGAVNRRLVARFIRRQAGKTMRARLRAALLEAQRLASRGDVAA